MCARTYKLASKPFHCVSMIILLFTIYYPFSFPFSLHALLYAAHHKGLYCASRVFACKRVFSTHFAAAAIIIRYFIHSRRRRTYTHTHTQRKAKLLAHTQSYTTATACALYILKKKRDEKAKTCTHTHIHTYSIHIYALCVCVRFFSRCRFSLLEPGSNEKQHHWLTGSHFSLSFSLSVALFPFSFLVSVFVVHSFIWQSLSREVKEKERQRAMIVFIR